MKTIAKLALVSVLALSAAPAFAASVVENTAPEALTLLERNTYLFTADAREIAQVGRQNQVRFDSAAQAFAQAPVAIDNDRHSVLRAF